MEDAVKYDPQADNMKAFEKKLENARSFAEKIDADAWNEAYSTEVTLTMHQAASFIKWLIKVVQFYDKTNKEFLEAYLKSRRDVEDVYFKWGVSQAILADTTVEAINILTEARRQVKSHDTKRTVE